MIETLISVTSAIADYLLIASAVAAILITAAGLAIKLGKIKAPVTRHLIWICALFVILIFPPAWLYGPEVSVAVLPHRDLSRVISTEPAASMPVPALLENSLSEIQLDAPVTETPPVGITRSPVRSIPAESILVCLWAIGLSFMILRLLLGFCRIHGIIRSAEPFPGDRLPESVRPTRSRLLLSRHVGSPFCFGLLRPSILLPETILNEENPESLHMILSHELAHIERRDCWINLFQRIVEAIFFFHPWIWYASSQLTQQREILCDHHVIAKGAAITEYARLLTRIVEQGQTEKHLHAVALFEGRLLARVKSLLEPGGKIRLKLSRWGAAAGFLTIALFLVAGIIRLETVSASSFEPQVETIGSSGVRPDGDCSISGRVVSAETGEPVSGVMLSLEPYRKKQNTIKIKAASDGTFEFKDISMGSYSLEASGNEGFQDKYYDYEDAGPVWFSLVAGDIISDIVLELEPAYTISGKVLGEDGKPISGRKLTVNAYRESEQTPWSSIKYTSVAHSEVADDGSYLLDSLGSRPVYVGVSESPYYEEKDPAPLPSFYYPGTLYEDKAELISFDGERHHEGIDFRLAQNTSFFVEGVVTDKETGKPISKTFIVLLPSTLQFSYCRVVYTDEAGYYRIDDMGPGDYLIFVDAKPWGYVRKRKAFELDNAAMTATLDFALSPAATIYGKLVDEEGNLIETSMAGDGGSTSDKSLSTSGTSHRMSTNRPVNKYAVEPLDGSKARNYFDNGEGDFGYESMVFPTPGTFIIQGVMPGKTQLNYSSRENGWTVKHILHDGRDLLGDVIETHPGEKIEEVLVVLSREEKVDLGTKNDDGTYNPDWLSIQSSRAYVALRYDALFEELDLSADKIEKFKTLLTDHNIVMTNVSDEYSTAPYEDISDEDKEAWLARRAEIDAEYESNLADLLGDAGYGIYRSFQETMKARDKVTEFEASLGVDDALTKDQTRALIEILHEQETEHEGAGIFENTSEPLSVEAQMLKSIENTEEIYRKTVEASVNILSDSQLEQLGTYFDKMIENRYGIMMISGSLMIQD